MKFNNKLFFVSLILCILFSISCVVASDVNGTVMSSDADEPTIAVDNENELIGDGNGVMESGDNGNFIALQLEISLAPEGSTINLSRDYYYNNEPLFNNGILINKDLTINGNGHTIDGKSIARIFIINYGDVLKQYKVTLNNITFKNGNAKIYGGAILNFADLTVDNCTFINNYAGTAGGAINSLGFLNLKNSLFDKNSAGGDAGAVFSLTLKIGFDFYKDYFANNTASENINLLLNISLQTLLEPGKDTIDNCVFTNNVANGRGGGAVYAYSHIDINHCTFKSNKAGEKGAAVFAAKDLYIKNSKFYSNKVSMYGGAVYFKCHEQSGHYENGKWVSSIKYYSNLIENSVFANNVADQRGGAIYGFRTSSSDYVHCAKAVKCTFSDNKSPKGKDIYGGTLKNCVYKNTKITLNTVKIKKSAKKITLTATLKKGSSPLGGKQVTFKFNGKTYKAKTYSNGVAKVNIYSNILKNLKVGKTVTYYASYGSFTAKKTAKVYK